MRGEEVIKKRSELEALISIRAGMIADNKNAESRGLEMEWVGKDFSNLADRMREIGETKYNEEEIRIEVNMFVDGEKYNETYSTYSPKDEGCLEKAERLEQLYRKTFRNIFSSSESRSPRRKTHRRTSNDDEGSPFYRRGDPR